MLGTPDQASGVPCGHLECFGLAAPHLTMPLGWSLLVSRSGFRKDVVDDAVDRRSSVNLHRVFRNMLFRRIQSRNEFPFFWFSAEVSWVQCHSLINSPVHGIEVDLQQKHAVK